MNEDELKKIIELASYPNTSSVRKEKRNKFYEKAFTKIASGKTFTWNWAACFFNTTWMLYRKMYLTSILVSLGAIFSYGILMIVAFLFVQLFSFILMLLKINFLQDSISINNFFEIICILMLPIIFILVGTISNYFYYIDLQHKVQLEYNLIHKKQRDRIVVNAEIKLIQN
ncbi:MAG: DUF2628 domain-containing protein [Candidatus Paracaedibacteraceae bacterium]|nr:DUF2628 domain-containing protein [Candidatus Paracaedibacteraceae bacterium]